MLAIQNRYLPYKPDTCHTNQIPAIQTRCIPHKLHVVFLGIEDHPQVYSCWLALRDSFYWAFSGRCRLEFSTAYLYLFAKSVDPPLSYHAAALIRHDVTELSCCRTHQKWCANNLDVAGQRKTIVRKAAQFITQPLFFQKAFVKKQWLCYELGCFAYMMCNNIHLHVLLLTRHGWVVWCSVATNSHRIMHYGLSPGRH